MPQDHVLLHVEAALLRLPECERKLLFLVAVRGHNYRDAAIQMGIDARTAALHLQSGLRQLRADPQFCNVFTGTRPGVA